MGNLITTVVPSLILPVENYLSELSLVSKPYKSLGSTRFFKVVRACHPEGPVVVKVLIKHDQALELKKYRADLEILKSSLTNTLNVIPFKIFYESERAAFLIRPYFMYSLYERMYAYPNLEPIEKKWIVFQILNALSCCHEKEICHGDLKAENILLTSWNWVQLADFATYKPVLLPPDNPAIFSFFFNASRRNVCYIAPERFSDIDNVLQHRMDIFSLGCVIIELFSGGQIPFDLPRLLDYSTEKYSPDSIFDLIDNKEIVTLARGMISLHPAKRYSAAKYLDLCRVKLFPDCFYSYLYHFIATFTNCTDPPHIKIRQLHRDMDQALDVITRSETERKIRDTPMLLLSCVTSLIQSSQFRASRLQSLELLKMLSKYLTDAIVLERILPYIMYYLREANNNSDMSSNTVNMDIKVVARAEEPVVRALAIHVLAHSLSNIKSIPNNELVLFPCYILPVLKSLVKDAEIPVQIELARGLGLLAEASCKFLELAQLAMFNKRSRSRTQPSQSSDRSYEEEWNELREAFQFIVVQLLCSQFNCVKRALLVDSLTLLCNFFGQQRANDVLLSHMITFLNDKKDWQIRAAFYDYVPVVAAFIGQPCLGILTPLIYQGLSDREEFVVHRAISCLTSLTNIELLRGEELRYMLKNVAPLLCHPSQSIRHSTVVFIVAGLNSVDMVDRHCKILPLISQFLNPDVRNNLYLLSIPDALSLHESIRLPLNRLLYSTACNYINQVQSILAKRLEDRKIKDTDMTDGDILPQNKLSQDLQIIYNKLLTAGLKEDQEDILLACLPKNRNDRSKFEEDANEGDPGYIGFKGIYLDENVPIHTAKISVISSDSTKSPQLDRKVKPKESLISRNISFKRDNIAVSDTSDLPSVFAKDWLKQSSIENLEETLTTAPGEEIGRSTSDGRKIHRATCAAELQSFLESQKQQYDQDSMWKPRYVLADRSNTDFNISDVNCLYGTPVTEKRGWIPQGHLLAHFHEHGSAINRIAVSPHLNMFCTASDDGSIKLWNTDRIEGRKLGSKARKSISINSGRVKTAVFCNEQIIACSTDDGSISVWRPLDTQSTNHLVYKKQLDVTEKGSLVDLSCFYYHRGEVLVGFTDHGFLIGLDLRTDRPAWNHNAHNKSSCGLVSSMCTDRLQNWITVGTTLGYYIAWDMRFLLSVNEWKHNSNSTYSKGVYKTIFRMSPHPCRTDSFLSAYNVNNEVVIWNIETATKTHMLCSNPNTYDSSSSRAGHDINNNNNSVRAILPFLSDECPIVLTAGTDQCVRMWNLSNPERSKRIIASADTESLRHDIRYSEIFKDDITIFQEETSPLKVVQKGTESRLKLEHPPKGHHDTITDLALVRTSASKDIPSANLIISTSRDGVMKVWK